MGSLKFFTPLERAPSFKAGLKEENKLFGKGLKPLQNFLTGFTAGRCSTRLPASFARGASHLATLLP